MKRVGGLAFIALGVIGARHAVRMPESPPRFVTVTAGANHACALTQRRQAYC